MEQDLQELKFSSLIKKLTLLKGSNGNSSVVTLLLPPNEQLPKINAKLIEEYGTAANIKSRVNRLSVLAAITSVQQKL